MAQTKNALIRQRVIDRCLRSPKQYSIMDMMEKCNVELEEAGYKPVTSKNTILEDLRGIENNFPEARIIQKKSGRYLFYEYEDKNFSIYNIPLDDDGMAKLAQTIFILSKFEGMPNFEWIDEIIDHFKSTLNIPTTKDSVVGFDDNFYLKNRNYFSRIFSAIVAEQTLIITYRPFGKDSIVYTFYPYYLKQYNKRWFLFGCVDGRSNLSNFPLDRIEDISNSPVPYVPNTMFDFNDLFEDVIGVSNLFDDAEVINFSVTSQSLDYTALANDVIDEVVQQMMDLMEDVKDSKTAGDEIGLSFQEMAFFDILKAVATKYDFIADFPDEKLSGLAKQVKELVEQQATVADWNNRDDIKAELKMNVIILLAGAGYPPKIHDEVFKEILEQAENFKRHAPSFGYSTADYDDTISIAAEP